MTQRWREMDSNHWSRSKGTGPLEFSRRDLLHRGANISRGRENATHASHQGIGSRALWCFYVKPMRLMAPPLALTAAMRPLATGLRG